MRRWRSFDPPCIGALPLPTTIASLLGALLARLEALAWLGRTLVGHALGDLAATRIGAAEDELLDLVARDDAVRDALHALSPYSPLIAAHLPLPMALWARLYTESEPLLTEREVDGVRLYTYIRSQTPDYRPGEGFVPVRFTDEELQQMVSETPQAR